MIERASAAGESRRRRRRPNAAVPVAVRCGKYTSCGVGNPQGVAQLRPRCKMMIWGCTQFRWRDGLSTLYTNFLTEDGGGTRARESSFTQKLSESITAKRKISLPARSTGNKVLLNFFGRAVKPISVSGQSRTTRRPRRPTNRTKFGAAVVVED